MHRSWERYRVSKNSLYICVLLCLLTLTACTLAPTPANLSPRRLYVFDASHLHLDHYEHCLTVAAQPGPCTTDRPPSGKSYSELLRDYDTLILVVTLQGIVNRDRPRLYLIHDRPPARQGVDKFWLETYRQPGKPYGWLAETELVELHSLSELLDVFADAVAGVVIWDPAVQLRLMWPRL